MFGELVAYTLHQNPVLRGAAEYVAVHAADPKAIRLLALPNTWKVNFYGHIYELAWHSV